MNGYKIYGPYRGKDNRDRVVLYKSRKDKITMSYPKYLYWKTTGILLPLYIDVHHKDEDPTNNVLSNFEIVARKKHMELHVFPAETYECVWCGEKLELVGIKLSRRKSRASLGIPGPFCSKKCTGEYGTEIQRQNKRHVAIVT